MTQPNRTVVWEPQFEREFLAIIPDVRRADEFISGVVWNLSRDPEEGVQSSPGSSVWMIFMHEFPNVPALTIYYTFNDECVQLRSVRCSVQGFG